MKKILVFTCLGLGLSAQAAGAVGIGLEAFGGVSYPVVQDDRESGGMWGIRVPVNLVPLIALEPYYGRANYGDKTLDTIAGSQTLQGGYVSSWGLNVILTSGTPVFRFFPYLGIGSSTDDHPPAGDVTKTAYNLGLGVGFGLPVVKLGVNVRAEGQMIVNGDTSRKFGNLTAGLSYTFLSLP